MLLTFNITAAIHSNHKLRRQCQTLLRRNKKIELSSLNKMVLIDLTEKQIEIIKLSEDKTHNNVAVDS